MLDGGKVDVTVRKWFRVLCVVVAMAMAVTACGGDDDEGTDTAADADLDEVEASSVPDTVATEPPSDEPSEPVVEDTAAPEAESAGSESTGNGAILADLCAGGQLVNGAVTIDDLVSFGLFTSTDVTIEGNDAYSASIYETFGFICNISETVGDGENFLTIGVKSGTAIWDLAAENGTDPVETMGDWEVIVGSNWLSPLTMRTTDDAGNQDSMFFTWTPSDGSTPDAETLERVMRPLAEAMTAGTTVDIPRS